MHKHVKQNHLGSMGERIVIKHLMDNGIVARQPINPFGDTNDIFIYPNFPKKDERIGAQVKTKVPYLTKRAASFDPEQWERYKQNHLFIICAPAPKLKDLDEWRGNVYHVERPYEHKLRPHTNSNGRSVVLLSLDDLGQPMLKIDDLTLSVMSEFVTDED